MDRIVSARLERQAILARDDPPMLWHVLHEGLPRHVVGSVPVAQGPDEDSGWAGPGRGRPTRRVRVGPGRPSWWRGTLPSPRCGLDLMAGLS